MRYVKYALAVAAMLAASQAFALESGRTIKIPMEMAAYLNVDVGDTLRSVKKIDTMDNGWEVWLFEVVEHPDRPFQFGYYLPDGSIVFGHLFRNGESVTFAYARKVQEEMQRKLFRLDEAAPLKCGSGPEKYRQTIVLFTSGSTQTAHRICKLFNNDPRFEVPATVYIKPTDPTGIAYAIAASSQTAAKIADMNDDAIVSWYDTNRATLLTLKATAREIASRSTQIAQKLDVADVDSILARGRSVTHAEKLNNEELAAFLLQHHLNKEGK